MVPCSHHKAWASGTSICNSARTCNGLLVRKLSGWQFVTILATWLARALIQQLQIPFRGAVAPSVDLVF